MIFSNFVSKIFIGLVGMGSECLGYDDEISRDHDFWTGFCIWLHKGLSRNWIRITKCI